MWPTRRVLWQKEAPQACQEATPPQTAVIQINPNHGIIWNHIVMPFAILVPQSWQLGKSCLCFPQPDRCGLFDLMSALRPPPFAGPQLQASGEIECQKICQIERRNLSQIECQYTCQKDPETTVCQTDTVYHSWDHLTVIFFPRSERSVWVVPVLQKGWLWKTPSSIRPSRDCSPSADTAQKSAHISVEIYMSFVRAVVGGIGEMCCGWDLRIFGSLWQM